MTQKKAPKMRIEGAPQTFEPKASAADERAAERVDTPAAVTAKVETSAPEKAADVTNPKEEQSPKAAQASETHKKKPTVHIDAQADPEPASQGNASHATGASAGAAASGKEGSASARTPYAWVSRIVPGHEHALLGGLAGLLIALLIFVVGFWQTVFITLLVFVGIALGQYLDGDPKIINLLRRLIAGGLGDE